MTEVLRDGRTMVAHELCIAERVGGAPGCGGGCGRELRHRVRVTEARAERFKKARCHGEAKRKVGEEALTGGARLPERGGAGLCGLGRRLRERRGVGASGMLG